MTAMASMALKWVLLMGTTYMWNAITGQSVQPVQPSQSYGSVSPGSNKHCILQQKVYNGDSSKYPQWLVRDNTDFGHWVSFHGKIIGRDRIGLTSIFYVVENGMERVGKGPWLG
jgi:hypothetical protein